MQRADLCQSFEGQLVVDGLSLDKQAEQVKVVVFALVFIEIAFLQHLLDRELDDLVVEELVEQGEALLHGLELGVDVGLYMLEL
jgi:hypothetical protein